MEIIELKDDEIDDILNEFYNYFKTGYEFEEFLKIFLSKIGLDEIEVTQKSRDGGIDLKCLKNGIDELSDLDVVKYYVQAKRFKPNTNVSISEVRALRGVMPDGYKGIFITTGKFSSESYKFAEDTSSRPIILIDGKKLIKNCIERGLGFKSKPIFDEESLSYLMKKEINKNEKAIKETKINIESFIKKEVTKNDIRTRILSIPTSIFEKLDNGKEEHIIKIQNKEEVNLKINRSRKYFGGVTEIFKKNGLIMGKEIFIPKMSLWKYDEKEEKIIIIFEEIEL